MAQDASEIREAIEQTRDEIGETVQAIGQKADVKARASEKVAETRALRQGIDRRSYGQGKRSRTTRGAKGARCCPAGRLSALGWAKSTGQPTADAGRRKKVAICVGLVSAAVVLMARRARRRRSQPC